MQPRSRQRRAQLRRVFGPPKRPQRWKQLLSGVLLLALGAGLLVALMQLPERLDTLLMVSTAIANLISGLGRFLTGLLQLLAVLLLVVVAIGALLLLLAGGIRLLRAVLPQPNRPSTTPPRSSRR
jgi:hypothetical protein